MKIMIIYGGFLPAKKYGGPVVSIANLVSFLNDSFWIVTRNREWKTNEKLPGIQAGWNTFNNHTKVLYLEDSEHGKERYISIIKEIEPDIVYINGFYSTQMYVPMIIAAQKMKKPILIAPRGTLNRNALSIKWMKKYPYVFFMRMLINKQRSFFQSTSGEETMRISRLLGIQMDHIFEVENVPSIPKSTYEHPVKEIGKLKCCFFARICESKNLLFALKILEKVKSNIEFNIYGNIEDQNYWDKCQQVIKDMPTNVYVNYKGGYIHDNVFELMSQNHILLFPTLSENYGHVIIEAMLSGLPVIISDQTPWNGVNEGKVGYAIALDKELNFIDAIESYAKMDETSYTDAKDRVVRFVDNALKLEELQNKYSNMYRRICEISNDYH